MKQKIIKSDIMMHIYVRLLDIIAIKLGYDWLLLMSDFSSSKEKWCSAVFGNHSNYNTVLLRANDKSVSIKFIDAKGCFRSNDDIYAELIGLLYKILENGGNVSDGKFKLTANEIPEFMINYAMSGCL